ncbi:MAG: hypothetical protein ACMXYC_01225 [Candidatus Woesearchaeota archaeon]
MSIETCVCTPTSETLDFEELVRQLADHNDITPTDDMLEPGAYHARIDDLFPVGFNTPELAPVIL